MWRVLIFFNGIVLSLAACPLVVFEGPLFRLRLCVLVRTGHILEAQTAFSQTLRQTAPLFGSLAGLWRNARRAKDRVRRGGRGGDHRHPLRYLRHGLVGKTGGNFFFEVIPPWGSSGRF